MSDSLSYDFDINGFLVHAGFSRAFLEECVHGLLRRWHDQAQDKQRLIVFLAAPPAAGKSTLAALFAHEAQRLGIPFQALGMDGFHHRQSYILTHEVKVEGRDVPMKQVKGCPESFDFDRLHEHLVRLRQEDTLLWPWYDRRHHDVIDDQIEVSAPLVLVEGNYLLLDEEPWRSLKPLCDVSMFLYAEETQLYARLIERKVRGGMMPHEAAAFAKGSDMRNVRRILDWRLHADVELILHEEGISW